MNRRGQDGFSLLEMIVVLVILGLALGLIAGRGPLHSARLDAEAAARDLTGAFRLARGRAIAENHPVVVAIGEHLYQIEGSAAHLVPQDVTLAGDAAIRFAPDGSSSGGIVTVQAAAFRSAVQVDWLTGRVRTEQQP